MARHIAVEKASGTILNVIEWDHELHPDYIYPDNLEFVRTDPVTATRLIPTGLINEGGKPIVREVEVVVGERAVHKIADKVDLIQYDGPASPGWHWDGVRAIDPHPDAPQEAVEQPQSGGMAIS